MNQSTLAHFCIFISGLFTYQVDASVLYSNDFAGENGSFPKEWFDPSHNEFTPEVVEIKNNTLFMARPDNPKDTAATRHALYMGKDSDLWQDYTVEAYFKNNHVSNRTGLIARWQNGTNSDTKKLKGYIAVVYENTIYISKDSSPNGGFDHAEYLLASNKFNRPLFGDQEARIVFSVSGSKLTAKVYIQSRSGEFDKLIGEVTANDSSYTHGSAGVMSRFLFRGRSTTWDNFKVTN